MVQVVAGGGRATGEEGNTDGELFTSSQSLGSAVYQSVLSIQHLLFRIDLCASCVESDSNGRAISDCIVKFDDLSHHNET